MATINEIITEVDTLRPNQYDDALKIEWLSNLDMKIMNNVILTHEQVPLSDDDIDEEFNGYDESDIGTELLVKEPYSALYKFYLFAMMDFYNGETTRYVNSMQMFNSTYQEFERHYNRTVMPKSKYLKV